MFSGLYSNATQCCGSCGRLHKTEAASIPAWGSRSSIVLEFSPETGQLMVSRGKERVFSRGVASGGVALLQGMAHTLEYMGRAKLDLGGYQQNKR